MTAQSRTIAIVQARMASTRLPGKVLAPVAGEPMILRQLQRVERARSLDGIVVATSTDPSDDELESIVRHAGYRVVRGALDDVLSRYIAAIDSSKAEVVVRITADCPLISPRVIDEVVRMFQGSDADYVSNTLEPTYPDGLDVEVVSADVLRAVCDVTRDPAEREHVTLGVYRYPDRFRVANASDPSGSDHSKLRWTVDTPDDLAFVRDVYSSLFPNNPEFEYEDVLALNQTDPKFRRDSSAGRRNAALDGLPTGAMRHEAGGGSP